MATRAKSASIIRAIIEAAVGAVLMLSIPAALLFATQQLHGNGHGLPRTVGLAVVSLLGVVLLIDAWRTMRQHEHFPANPQDRTGGGPIH